MGIEVALAVAALGMSGVQTHKQMSSAKKQEKQQKSQADLQRRVEQIRARREARIKSATFLAQSSASGAGGSFVGGVTTGIESSLKGGIETSNQQYALQNKMFENQREATTQAAFFDLGQSVIGAGASMASTGMFDSTSTQVTAANRPGGTGTPMYFLPNA